ncbi:hypothetical protein ACFW1M_09610 [Streptomyces inhibens]|uniref:hypothetical protein n=1 Tax=Streptomyces inhibens TaxID=2293571 RepID=UPI003687F493
MSTLTTVFRSLPEVRCHWTSQNSADLDKLNIHQSMRLRIDHSLDESRAKP